MADTLTILVDDAQAQRWFGQLLARGSNMTGLMADIGEYLLESTQGRFDTGIGPDGIAWAPLKDGSGRTPLNQTRRMRDDMSPSSGADWVELTAHAKQARWHQEGTDPYEIRAKNGKALSWPGGPGPRAKVNHPGLPARPFMGISDEDDRKIAELAIAWLELEDSAG